MQDSAEQIQTEQTQTSDQTVAAKGDLGLRSIAALVDIVILAVLFFIMSALFGRSDVDGSSFSVSLTGGGFLLFLILWFLYFEILETKYSQTVGKMLFKLRVKRVDGTKPDAGAIAVRTIFRVIDGLPFLYLLGFIVAAGKEGKQRIGDLVGNTMVVKDD